MSAPNSNRSLFQSLRQRPPLRTLGPIGTVNPEARVLAPEELEALLNVAQAAAEYVDELETNGMAEDNELVKALEVLGV